jgi:ABC-type sugar transport system permease subunit
LIITNHRSVLVRGTERISYKEEILRREKKHKSFLTKNQFMKGFVFVIPFMVVWGVFLAWPTVYGVFLSLRQWQGPMGSTFVGLENYRLLFNEPRFWNALKNTLVFAALAIPMIVIIGMLFALLLFKARQVPRAAAFGQAAFFFPYLLTVSIIALTWLWLLDGAYGLIPQGLSVFGITLPNFLNEPALILPVIAFVTAWWLAGYRMIVFQAGLEDIPPELFEVADIDGARSLMKFRHIILPLLKPTILYTVILTIISGFRTFGQVLVMTEGGPGRASEVLALYLYWVGFDYFQPGKAAAAGVVLLFLIMICTIFAIRRIGLHSELAGGK